MKENGHYRALALLVTCLGIAEEHVAQVFVFGRHQHRQRPLHRRKLRRRKRSAAARAGTISTFENSSEPEERALARRALQFRHVSWKWKTRSRNSTKAQKPDSSVELGFYFISEISFEKDSTISVYLYAWTPIEPFISSANCHRRQKHQKQSRIETCRLDPNFDYTCPCACLLRNCQTQARASVGPCGTRVHLKYART